MATRASVYSVIEGSKLKRAKLAEVVIYWLSF